MVKYSAHIRYSLSTFSMHISGPCVNNGKLPINIDPSGPGIRLPKIIFLPNFTSSFDIAINHTLNIIVIITYHMFIEFAKLIKPVKILPFEILVVNMLCWWLLFLYVEI